MAAEDVDQFTDDPRGWAKRWSTELTAARKKLERWHQQGDKIDKRYRDDREPGENGETRLNLFTSGTEVKQAILYGQVPKAEVSRRFADAQDDEARVAAESLERLINTDIERTDDTYAIAIQYALEDRLLPGWGQARVRYVVEMEDVPEQPAKLGPDGAELAPLVPATQRKAHEDVEVDYIHWKDQLWSPARVWHEVRWWAHKSDMSRSKLVERFGEEVGRAVPLNAPNGKQDEKAQATPWDRAEVWEIWDKESRCVYWYVDGHPTTLDKKYDPLGLAGFFPCPRPMVAGATTSGLVPRPDFVVAQDLYQSIDQLSTRIALLRDAIRVAGVYDKTATQVKQLLDPTGKVGNQLYPVDNWAMFGEKGGIRGQIDWLPLDQITGALTTLRDVRAGEIEDLYQLTGMSDIMRGQASSPNVTATEQGIKARFGSVRMQRMQDEFARFASDLLRLKAEVIAKHFDAATILERCNCARTPDAAIAPAAVELLKSRFAEYRIVVKPEAVSLTDFAALKQERTEVIGAVAQFLSSAAPLGQASPAAMPFLLEILQWMVSGLRGSSAIEGVLDRAIQAAQQQAQQPQAQAPDPKLEATRLKGEMDRQKVQEELQADMVRLQAEVAADAQREQNQANWNVREAVAKQRVTAMGRALQPQPVRPLGGVKPGGGL